MKDGYQQAPNQILSARCAKETLASSMARGHAHRETLRARFSPRAKTQGCRGIVNSVTGFYEERNTKYTLGANKKTQELKVVLITGFPSSGNCHIIF